MSEPDITTSSIADLAAALRNGSTSASALAEWAIANHEDRGEVLHAYKAWEPDRFRAEAAAADAVLAAGIDLGPMHGIHPEV